jgi:hypothetical protein
VYDGGIAAHWAKEVVMAYGVDLYEEQDEAERLQGLIDSGTAWTLEGSVGRAAMRAIESGLCVLGPSSHRDYWGNYIPSRFEVQAGTKGSVDYANERREELGLPPLDLDERSNERLH